MSMKKFILSKSGTWHRRPLHGTKHAVNVYKKIMKMDACIEADHEAEV